VCDRCGGARRILGPLQGEFLPHLSDLPSPLPGRSAASYTAATVTTRPLGGHQAHQAGGRETRNRLPSGRQETVPFSGGDKKRAEERLRPEDHVRAWWKGRPNVQGAEVTVADAFVLGRRIFGDLLP
jgi:hypothetical protein